MTIARPKGDPDRVNLDAGTVEIFSVKFSQTGLIRVLSGFETDFPGKTMRDDETIPVGLRGSNCGKRCGGREAEYYFHAR